MSYLICQYGPPGPRPPPPACDRRPSRCGALLAPLALSRLAPGSCTRVGMLATALAPICATFGHHCWLGWRCSSPPFRTYNHQRTIGEPRANGQGGGAEGHSFWSSLVKSGWPNHFSLKKPRGRGRKKRLSLFTKETDWHHIWPPIKQPNQLYRNLRATRYVIKWTCSPLRYKMDMGFAALSPLFATL